MTIWPGVLAVCLPVLVFLLMALGWWWSERARKRSERER